ALVDDPTVLGRRHALDLPGLGRIDEIEQGRKGVAQAHAAPATVTDVEHARELRIERGLVVEIRIAPIDRMPGRSLEVAFADGHATWRGCGGSGGRSGH